MCTRSDGLWSCGAAGALVLLLSVEGSGGSRWLSQMSPLPAPPGLRVRVPGEDECGEGLLGLQVWSGEKLRVAPQRTFLLLFVNRVFHL